MKVKIAVLEGDGVGPEVTRQSIKVLNALSKRFGHEVEIRSRLIGAAEISRSGVPLTDATIEVCKSCDAVLLGAVGNYTHREYTAGNQRPEAGLLRLRYELGTYANLRPVHYFPTLSSTIPIKSSFVEGVNMLIVRELTGGIYFGAKGINEEATQAHDSCVYSRDEILRVSHVAFEQARRRRKKVTLIDKANVLETSKLWRAVVKEVATKYDDVVLEFLYVDNAAMQLITNPRKFDVVLTDNMFGDILSDEASVISGSIGLLPSASIGNGVGIFEPVHGSYPEAEGQDIANPFGSILSVGMMFDFLGMKSETYAIESGIQWALESGFVTKDICSQTYYPCSLVGTAIADYIANIFSEGGRSENTFLGRSTII